MKQGTCVCVCVCVCVFVCAKGSSVRIQFYATQLETSLLAKWTILIHDIV